MFGRCDRDLICEEWKTRLEGTVELDPSKSEVAALANIDLSCNYGSFARLSLQKAQCKYWLHRSGQKEHWQRNLKLYKVFEFHKIADAAHVPSLLSTKKQWIC